MTQHQGFWAGVLALTSDKRFLVPMSMPPFVTIWLLVLASRHSFSEPAVAHRAALATLQFALLWALALACLFLLWLAGTRILLADGVELSRALVVSGATSFLVFSVAAVGLLRKC